MVKNSSLQEVITKAQEPTTKPRNKKYTKTRPKKDQNPKPSNPETKWWKRSSLYQLLCCQNTCYSVILYLALLVFIALFIYAVWKICDLRFASKFHNAHKKPETNHSMPTTPAKDHGIRGHVSKHGFNHIDSGSSNIALNQPSNKHYDAEKQNLGLQNGLEYSKWKSQPTQAMPAQSIPRVPLAPYLPYSTMNPWLLGNQNPDVAQGDKRYIIPPSPSHFQNYYNTLEGSGGNTLDEWRLMRLALLKNRLKLTTGSSYPTENPYWKALYSSRFQTVSPWLGQDVQGLTDVKAIHDDANNGGGAIIPPIVSKNKATMTKPQGAELAKHSEIDHANSTLPKAYNKLLQDLFDKLKTLRDSKSTAKPLQIGPIRNVPTMSGNSLLTTLSAMSRNVFNNSSSNLGPQNTTFNKGVTTTASTTRTALTTKTTQPSTTKQTTTTATTKASTTLASTTTATTTHKIATKATTKATQGTMKAKRHHKLKYRFSKKKHSRNWHKMHSAKYAGHKRKKHHLRQHKGHHKNHKNYASKRSKRPNKDIDKDEVNVKDENEASGSSGSGDTIFSGSGSGDAYSGSGVKDEEREDGSGAASGEDEAGKPKKKGGYIGLRERLRKLKHNKHGHGKGNKHNHNHEKKNENEIGHRRNEIHHKQHEKKHEKHKHNKKHDKKRGTKHDKKHEKKHGMKHDKKHDKGHDKKHHKSSTRKKKKNHGKEHGKSSKKSSNKHKFMNIIQRKLSKVRKKNQIASRLSKVQQKMKEIRKRKHKKKLDKTGNKRSKINRVNAPSTKLLDRPINKKERPKHWRSGHVKVDGCIVVKEFEKHYYVGINKLWNSGTKTTFVLTECSVKNKHKGMFKCRRTFYKTRGYLSLKTEKGGKKNRLLLVLCRKKEDLKQITQVGNEKMKKAKIVYEDKKKHENDEGRKREMKRKHKHHKGHHGKKESDRRAHKRSEIIKAKRRKRNHRSRHRKSHKKHHKRKKSIRHHHRHRTMKRRHRHAVRKNDDDVDDDNDEKYMDDYSSGSGSGSGSDDDSSGDAEERVERSTNSAQDQHHRRHRKRKSTHYHHYNHHHHGKKHGSGQNSHHKQHGSNKTSNVTAAEGSNKGNNKMYAEVFDMMKEMKQELQNVTAYEKKALQMPSNISMVLGNSSTGHSNISAAKTTPKSVATIATTTASNITKAVKTNSTNAIKPGTLQDMVAQLVPAIMRQFEAKPLPIPTIKVDTKTTTTGAKLTSVTTTTKLTTTAKPTTKVTTLKTTTTTQTIPTTKTTPTAPTTPTTKPTTKPTTTTMKTTKKRQPTTHPLLHHTTPHHSTPHHHSVTHHHTTKPKSKPKPKTTQGPNLSMILKGLKALGLAPANQQASTGQPSPSDHHSAAPTKTLVKKTTIAQPPTTALITKQQQHLPPPIPKPLKLHNPFLMNLLCFGDSLTAGYHNHGKAFAPYGNHLKQLISLSNRTPVSMKIKGIVGEMTHKQMVSRLPEILGNNTAFDWVFLLGGTNDILHVKNFADDQEFLSQLESVWQPRITKDIVKLHTIAHNHGAHTMLLTIPENAIEQWPGYKILLTMRTKINNALRQYATQHRDKVALCDIAKRLPRHSLMPRQEALFWDDHLHMTPMGYNRMAEEVFKCLKPYLPHR